MLVSKFPSMLGMFCEKHHKSSLVLVLRLNVYSVGSSSPALPATISAEVSCEAWCWLRLLEPSSSS